MTGSVLVLTENWKGRLSDVSLELLVLGRELATALEVPLHALLLGQGVQGLADSLGAADKVLHAEHPALAEPNPEAQLQVLKMIWQGQQPRCLLAPVTNVTWDLLSLLPGEVQARLLTSCRDVRALDGGIEAHCVLHGGKIEVAVQSDLPVILGVLPGARSAEDARSSRNPQVETLAVGPLAPSRVQFRRLIEPEAGDVDIKRQPVLVAVGRGIQSKENLEMAEALAAELGGAVCGSRPVIDQGWLPATRQVGKSGETVKPRLYLALGISGAPEHVEGMKNSDLIIAVNTDPQAPIFDVAHYGVVGDALELLPVLSKALAGKKV
jgi:electron transfer flavoprotein alpha subunit